MTNAERQARWREKREAELKTLTARVRALEAENAKLKKATAEHEETVRPKPEPLYTPPPGGTDRERSMDHDEQQHIMRLRALWKSGTRKISVILHRSR